VRTEDGYIIRKCLNGDSEAFGFLVDKYRESVYAFAYSRLRSFDDAEDVAQDALLTAYEKITDLKQPSRFGAWLCSIAARKASRRWKSKAREQERNVLDERPVSSEYDVWDALEAGELRRAATGLIQELSQLHREAIELYYFQGYTVAEIAKFLDVPPGTVKRRLHDARERLKAALSETFGQDTLEEFKGRLT